MAPIDKVRAVDGKLKVLTPKRMKELYDKSIETGEPLVLWAADESYIRKLEEWIRDNMRYTRELQAHKTFLLRTLTEIRKETEGSVSIPDDP